MNYFIKLVGVICVVAVLAFASFFILDGLKEKNVSAPRFTEVELVVNRVITNHIEQCHFEQAGMNDISLVVAKRMVSNHLVKYHAVTNVTPSNME